MGGICKQPGRERGLWYEIQCLEKDLQSKTLSEESRKFIKGLLRSYKKYDEQTYAEGFKPTGTSVRAKSGRLKVE